MNRKKKNKQAQWDNALREVREERMNYPGYWAMRYIVRTVRGEAQTENIFHSEVIAQNFCTEQLAQGLCAYITERWYDTSNDVPF